MQGNHFWLLYKYAWKDRCASQFPNCKYIYSDLLRYSLAKQTPRKSVNFHFACTLILALPLNWRAHSQPSFPSTLVLGSKYEDHFWTLYQNCKLQTYTHESRTNSYVSNPHITLSMGTALTILKERHFLQEAGEWRTHSLFWFPTPLGWKSNWRGSFQLLYRQALKSTYTIQFQYCKHTVQITLHVISKAKPRVSLSFVQMLELSFRSKGLKNKFNFLISIYIRFGAKIKELFLPNYCIKGLKDLSLTTFILQHTHGKHIWRYWYVLAEPEILNPKLWHITSEEQREAAAKWFLFSFLLHRCHALLTCQLQRSQKIGNSFHLNRHNFKNIRWLIRTWLWTENGGQVGARPRSRCLNTTSSNICLSRLTPQLHSIAQCLCSIPHCKSCCNINLCGFVII